MKARPSRRYFISQAVLNTHGYAWMKMVLLMEQMFPKYPPLWPSEVEQIRAEYRRLYREWDPA